MKYVKFALMGLGALGAILTVAYGVLSAGVHGVIVIVGCLLPVAFGALSLVKKSGMPRWASIVSAIGLLLAAMKTRSGDDVQNIMVVAFIAFILAVVLAIKPDSAPEEAAASEG